ncbi:MAG TPA: hypothetical protein VNI20_04055 [Fimbriimonadaceae bacterium]|nr:hypothetical protein [Fimbriimonadaceae bacterium]
MRRILVAAAVVLTAVGCVPKKQAVAPIEKRPAVPHVGRSLDPSLRPLVELAPFRGMKYVSVSEYDSQLEGALNIDRVFRMTYRAHLEDEVKRLRGILPESDGWYLSGKGPYYFSKDYPDGKVATHAMVVQSGRIERDESVFTKTMMHPDDNYVSISFNEIYFPKESEPLRQIAVFSADRGQHVMVDVPRSAYIADTLRKPGSITVDLIQAPDPNDGTQQLLEIWLSDGIQSYAVEVQVSKAMEQVPGVSGLDIDHAVLLGEKGQVGTLAVSRKGKAFTVSGLDPKRNVTAVISRWIPKSVPAPAVLPEVIYTRVSSVVFDQNALPFPRPNLGLFFQPVSSQL